MEVHQLRYAVAVADSGSFTAAAAALNVSQSGVSAQVGRLEHELGVRLFERSARRVTVTPAGIDLLDRMRHALAAIADVPSVADEVLGLVRGSVRLGSVAGLGWPAFLDAVEQVHDAHPQLALSLREGNSAALQSDVLAGRLDVAIVSWVDEPMSGLRWFVAVEERVAAAVGADHRWTTRAGVAPAELLDVPVVCLAAGTGVRAAYETMMTREGLPAPVSWEVTLPTTARALASRGLGAAVLTTSSADVPDALVYVPIESDYARSYLGVVWRSEHAISAAARTVLEALHAHLRPTGEQVSTGRRH
jgi:DNA-binding transcriptional LysR family regulator